MDDHVELEPAPMAVKLERVGSLVVAVLDDDIPIKLTQSDVDGVLAAVRDERYAQFVIDAQFVDVIGVEAPP